MSPSTPTRGSPCGHGGNLLLLLAPPELPLPHSDQHSHMSQGGTLSGASGGKGTRSPETQTETRASSRSHIPAASPVWAEGLDKGQGNTGHAFCHLLAAPFTRARLGAWRTTWASIHCGQRQGRYTCPRTSPATGREKRNAAPSCCSSPTPPASHSGGAMSHQGYSPTSLSQTRWALTQGLGPFDSQSGGGGLGTN